MPCIDQSQPDSEEPIPKRMRTLRDRVLNQKSRPLSSPQLLRPSLPPYLEFVPQCKVLLCNIHGGCFTCIELTHHLEQHHECSPETSDRIAQSASALGVVFARTAIQFPAPDAAPIKGLDVIRGYKCIAAGNCPYLNPKFTSFRMHLSQMHRSQLSEQQIQFLYKEVNLQNLFAKPFKPAYFVVGSEDKALNTPPVSVTSKHRLGSRTSTGQKQEEVIDLEHNEVIEREVRERSGFRVGYCIDCTSNLAQHGVQIEYQNLTPALRRPLHHGLQHDEVCKRISLKNLPPSRHLLRWYSALSEQIPRKFIFAWLLIY